MIGGLFKRLKGVAATLANSSVKAENKDLMEAMIAGAALVAYADGQLDVEEVDAVRSIVGSSTQLKAFGDEPIVLFDKYCDKMEASARMGKLDLMKEISEVAGQTENAQRVLILGIEVADSKGEIAPEEEVVLEQIASKLGLKLSDYI